MLFSLRFSKSDVLVIRLDDKTQRQLRRVLSSSHSAHPVDVAVSPIWRQNRAAYGSRTWNYTIYLPVGLLQGRC